MRCQICKEKCDGKIIIRDPNIEKGLKVCDDCLNDYGNQNYDNLSKKLKKKKSL